MGLKPNGANSRPHHPSYSLDDAYNELRATGLPVKREDSGLRSPCPLHPGGSREDDLHTFIGDDGEVKFECFSRGCSIPDIRRALGSLSYTAPPRAKRERKQIGEPFPWLIRNCDGKVVTTHTRINYDDGTKGFYWPKGTKPRELPLYGAHQIKKWKKAAEKAGVPCRIFITEGEKDRDALAAKGFLAAGTVTGAKMKTVDGKHVATDIPCDESLLDFKGTIPVLWADNDEVGYAHMEAIAERFLALGIEPQWFIDWEAKNLGDGAADFFARGMTADDLRRMLGPDQPAIPNAIGHTPDMVDGVRVYGWKWKNGDGNMVWADDKPDEPIFSTYALKEGEPVAPVASVAWGLPLPLLRETPPAEEFPIDALGPLMEGAAREINGEKQAPMALCAQSVLAAASFAVQALVDVEMPKKLGGGRRPTVEDFVTLAESGDRKTNADGLACSPIETFENTLTLNYENNKAEYQTTYAIWRARHEALLKEVTKSAPTKTDDDLKMHDASEPLKPLLAQIICQEPTTEAVEKLLDEGRGSAAMASDEGGQFLGGHAMQSDRFLKTISFLSKRWDGADLSITRVGRGIFKARGKRFGIHLLMQPNVARRLFNDEEVRRQGITGRFLAIYPDTLRGARFTANVNYDHELELRKFHDRLRDLLNEPLKLRAGSRNELDPVVLTFAPNAANALVCFYDDEIEKKLAPDGDLDSIKELANKMTEHACRLAAILHTFENPAAISEEAARIISRETALDAIKIARFYLGEALRIYSVPAFDMQLFLADKTRIWLYDKWGKDRISLREFYRLGGPVALRNKATASRIAQLLVDHGWLHPVDGQMGEWWVAPKVRAPLTDATHATDATNPPELTDAEDDYWPDVAGEEETVI